MKLRFALLSAALGTVLCFIGCQSAPQAAVRSDPYEVRISRLSNGVNVYLSPNREKPQVVTMIGFPSGGQNDPNDKTGLAHYLEHLLFKGTSKLGTTDYQSEKVLLDKIEKLYQEHEKTADPAKRREIYREIDQLSTAAAQYAAPNEFVRAIQSMGGSGTNAYTGLDRTVYLDTVPSNQLHKWMKLETERFRDPVFRGFHTELETVFEEYNMMQDRTSSKFWELVLSTVYAGHPAARPLIGTPEHLKNPSPERVMKFYRERYTPSDMYVILAGDFDPDRTLAQLEATLGTLPAAPKPAKLDAIPAPVKGESVREIVQPDFAMALLVWRIDRPTRRDFDLAELIAKILSNGSAGLFDQNLQIPQKVPAAFTSVGDIQGGILTIMAGALAPAGTQPEAVRELLDGEIAKLKKGDFPDWLPGAIIDHQRLAELRSLPDNYARANRMLEAALTGRAWSDELDKLKRMERLTKQEIVDFARQNLGGDRFVFYRRTGPREPGVKLDKPAITPLAIRRDASSDFYRELTAIPAPELDLEFPDLKRDVRREQLTYRDQGRELPLTAVANKRNELFNLTLVFDAGTDHDRLLGAAAPYAMLAGTRSMTAPEFNLALYRLSGNISLTSGRDEVYLNISGLTKNMAPLLNLAHQLLTETRDNPDALKKMVETLKLARKMERERPQSILFSGLANYARYGVDSPLMAEPSNAELDALKPEQLIATLAKLPSYPCRIRYYGPLQPAELDRRLAAELKLPALEKAPETPHKFTTVKRDKREVYLVNVPKLQQVQLLFFEAKELFNPDNAALRQLFNEYFGGGMSSVIFQEIREAKSLAYSSYGSYTTPRLPDEPHTFQIFLSTQPDKVGDAIAAVEALGFPISPVSFEKSRETILQRFRAERWRDQALIGVAEEFRRKGLPDDFYARNWTKLNAAKLEDLKQFYNDKVKTVPNLLLVVGDATRIDRKALEK
ncbi:MAG: M16 family metallopeptidase, partial [Victivallaceae bacterium]